MNLLDRIRQAAVKKGVTLTEMERDLGFSNSSIRKWEQASPSLEKVKSVAEYLGVSIDWLAYGNTQANDKNDLFVKQFNRLSESDKIKVQGFIEITLFNQTKKRRTVSNAVQDY